jgi:hypothetical protein
MQEAMNNKKQRKLVLRRFNTTSMGKEIKMCCETKPMGSDRIGAFQLPQPS